MNQFLQSSGRVLAPRAPRRARRVRPTTDFYFQGLENQTTAFSKPWEISRSIFPSLGKNTSLLFQGLENSVTGRRV